MIITELENDKDICCIDGCSEIGCWVKASNVYHGWELFLCVFHKGKFGKS